RLMPVGQGAWPRVVRQVGGEPLRLWARGTAAADVGQVAVRVEGDNVPAAHVERVVAGRLRMGGRPEEVELVLSGIVRVRTGSSRVGVGDGVVLVVSDRRRGDAQQPAETGGVAG